MLFGPAGACGRCRHLPGLVGVGVAGLPGAPVGAGLWLGLWAALWALEGGRLIGQASGTNKLGFWANDTRSDRI